MSLVKNFETFFELIKKSLAALVGRLDKTDQDILDIKKELEEKEKKILLLQEGIVNKNNQILLLNEKIAELEGIISNATARINEGLVFINTFNNDNNIEII